MAPTGLRPRELLALQHLQERGPSAQQTLAELVGVDATNIVAVLNSLEDAGLIDRRRDRADRRRAIIALSAQGEQRLALLDRALREVDDEILAPLSPADRAMLDYATKLTKDATRVGPKDHERLRAVGFDDRGILQITLIASWFNYINRVADALGVGRE